MAASIEGRLHLAAPTEKAHRRKAVTALVEPKNLMTEYRAGKLDELKEGGRLLLKCGSAEIGIFRNGGKLYAWHNECAHRGGPVCQGRIMQRVIEPVASDGTARTLEYHEDTHIVCPWHGYEFNIKTGRHPIRPSLGLRKADVSVRDGEVYVSL